MRERLIYGADLKQTNLKTVRTEGIAREVVLDGKQTIYESLILAQDERWRRA